VPNRLKVGVQVPERIVRGEGAEIDAQRQDKLNQASAAFPKLEDGSPKDIGEDETNKVKVLRQLKREMRQHPVRGLVHDFVGEPGGGTQQEKCSQSQIAFSLHLIKDEGIQAKKGEIQTDGKQSIGVKIEVRVLQGVHSRMSENRVATNAHQERKPHVHI